MILKEYRCKRFAGIKDQQIQFSEGLNVILGPNEAGKSTLVEGIFAVLFKSSKVGLRSVEDKDFRARFLPVPAGDSIDGILTFSDAAGSHTYQLERAWGQNPLSRLTLPDGQLVSNEDSIHNLLKEVSLFGEGTYQSVIFARQIHLKNALEQILENKEATGEISTLLRRTIMELDGVSLDELGSRIDAELERLLKRWDLDRGAPENNRGISNPYLVGVGEILAAYYQKERTRLAMGDAQKAEQDMEAIYQQLRGVEQELAELKSRKEGWEGLEEDVLRRALLEPKLVQLTKELGELSRINAKWPQHQMRLAQLTEEQTKLEQDKARLELERGLLDQAVRKAALEKTVSRVQQLQQELATLEEKIAGIPQVTREELKILEESHAGMVTTEARMKAGKLYGQVRSVSEKANLRITRDLSQPESVTAGDSFEANGFVRLEAGELAGELLEIEFKTGQMDFGQLRDQHAKHQETLQDLLHTLGVASIEDAKWKREAREALLRDLDGMRRQLLELLGESTVEELEQSLAAMANLAEARPRAQIDGEFNALQSRAMDLSGELRVIQGDIERWQESFAGPDGVLDKIIDCRTQEKSVRGELERLSALPEGFASAEAFRKELTDTRKALEDRGNTLTRLKDAYHQQEKNLPDSTFEELSANLELEEQVFQQKIRKAQKLLAVKEAYRSTRASMDANSLEPVVASFASHLRELTSSSIRQASIGDGFELQILNGQQQQIPLPLLSAGTYDSVALALRLAVLEHVLGDRQGFLVLDDCLVDLDPRRKEKAAALIQRFAQKHQVIFTTCSPETAELLSGNLVELGQ